MMATRMRATNMLLVSRRARRVLNDLRNESRAVQRSGSVRSARIITESAAVLEEEIRRLEGENSQLGLRLETSTSEQDRLRDALLKCAEEDDG
jgi:hypothetical protein